MELFKKRFITHLLVFSSLYTTEPIKRDINPIPQQLTICGETQRQSEEGVALVLNEEPHCQSQGQGEKIDLAKPLQADGHLLGARVDKRHALYLMHTDQITTAIEKYQEMANSSGPDFEILRQMAFSLMKQGTKKDTESCLLSMYGAGLAANASSLEILEEGLLSKDPQTQMAALFFIAQINDNYSDDLLLQAMNSEFLTTRLEACFHMAIRKHPHAVGHIEALMYRLPPFFKAFFPPFFALIGNNEALAILHRLLSDSSSIVRIEAIHSLIQFERDDFIPAIRKCLTYGNYAEKEACAYALGILKDSSAQNELKKLSLSSTDSTRLAALKALYTLGDHAIKIEIEKMAIEKNLFAIGVLGQMPGSENLLAELTKDSNLQVRMNAALSLLQRRDSRCLTTLKEILLGDARDLAFQPQFSAGKAHQAIRIVPCAKQRNKDPLFDPDISLTLKESYLTQALLLEEEDFLQIAEMIFESKQNELIPTLITLLEKLQSEKAILLLKSQTQKMGAPLIRDYCNLALFRLKEKGPYEDNLIKWIMRQKKEAIIKLRPTKVKSKQEVSFFSLSPEETSRLLIDSYAALAARQDSKSIDIVLTALKEGNPKNRYTLAGLLMRATE